jgi:hypothetical protein
VSAGKKQFPYLVDPNTGISMYESDDIIAYVSDGRWCRLFRLLLSQLAGAALAEGRAMQGFTATLLAHACSCSGRMVMVRSLAS